MEAICQMMLMNGLFSVVEKDFDSKGLPSQFFITEINHILERKMAVIKFQMFEIGFIKF